MQTLILKLESLNKSFYTIADIQKVSPLPLPSLKVALSRTVKAGRLIRLRRNIYALPDKAVNTRELATRLYTPSYISFESALADYGIVSQLPYTITCATTKRSKRVVLANTEIEYRQLKKKLFFGYQKMENYFIATPEKALLDSFYLISRGKLSLKLTTLDLTSVKKKELSALAKSFPSRVQELIAKTT